LRPPPATCDVEIDGESYLHPSRAGAEVVVIRTSSAGQLRDKLTDLTDGDGVVGEDRSR